MHEGKSWRRRLVDRVRLRLLLLAAGAVIAVALYVVAGRQLVQLVPDYRAHVEQLLSERLDASVSIGYLGARMDGVTPVLELGNVALAGADPQSSVRPLRIQRLELGVDLLPSLVNRGLRANNVLVEGVQVTLQRGEDGRFSLKGIEAFGRTDAPQDPDAVRRLLALMYRQKHLLVNDLDLVIELPGKKPVLFSDVEMAFATSGERHRFAFLATEARSRLALDVRFSLDRDAYAFSELSGNGYVRVTADRPDFLRNEVPGLPVNLADSGVDIKAWLTLQNGEAMDGFFRLRGEQLQIRHEKLRAPMMLEQIRLNGELSRDGDVYQMALAATDARLDGRALDLPPMAVSLTPGEESSGHAWEVGAGRIDVARLLAFLRQVPLQLPEKLQNVDQVLVESDPSGVLESAWVAGKGSQPEQFALRFTALDIKPRGKVPGVRGVSGWLAGTPDSGLVQLDSDVLALRLPVLYHQPLRASVQGAIAWRRNGDGIKLETDWITVNNEDARGRAVATVRIRPGQVPKLSLLASLVQGRADNAASYIPLKRLPDAAEAWLAQAFVSGRVDRGQFLHEGPVKIDPDFQERRTLQMAFSVRDATLQFLPDWPAATALSGDVFLDGRRIVGRNVRARFLDSTLTGVSADIPEYEGEEFPILILSGKVDGPVRDLQSVLQDTPLAQTVPDELLAWQMPEGVMEADMLVHWPLKSDTGMAPTFLASGRVQNTVLSSEARGLELSALGGDLFFSLEDGLFSKAFNASVLGGPVSGRIATTDDQLQVSMNGDATVAALVDWLSADWLAPASGDFSYQGQLLFPWRQPGNVMINMQTPLAGVAIDLPAPLGKPAATRWPLSVAVELRQPGPRIELDSPARLSGWLQLDDNGLAAARIGLGDTLGLPANADDVRVQGRFDQFAVEPWVDWVNQGERDGEGLPLDRLEVTSEQMDVFGIATQGAYLQLVPAGGGWDVDLNSDQLVATVQLPADYTLRGTRPMKVVVSHARIGADGEGIGNLDPRQVPVADVNVSGAVYDGEDMGNWSFHVRPVEAGVSLEALQASWRFTELAGKATWTVAGDGQQTRFIGAAASDHLKRTALAWDLPPLVEGRKGEAVMDLSWSGSPLDVDYLATRGSVAVDIGASRIPNTDSRTSALRMLGVMNFASVSRRLRLDFSDLYKKGLSCDRISGDFEIDGPDVETRNLIIKSPSAEFRVSGSLDMEEETVNQRVDVTLPVSSNLYLGCLAGPTACAGIFVVERLWGSKLEKMTSVAYSVTGTWDNPSVKEIEGIFERKK
jgi:uncharacterized protein (TIGR02099 family)